MKKGITILKTENNEYDFDMEFATVEIDIRKERLESNRQDRVERKRYAGKVFYFIAAFIAVVLLILVLSGLQCARFNLSDNVLIVLLTTSSANVIGIFMIVVKYLFKDKDI